MNVVHVSDGYVPRVGGIERQVHDLAARQAESGHGVRVLTAVPGDRRDGFVRVVRPRPLGAVRTERIRYGWAWHGCDRRLLRDADVVHVHASTWSPLGFLALGTAVRAGVPAVATLHSLWHYAEPAFRGADRLARWSRWPVVWSAVSTAAAAPLARVVGPTAPVHVLPNAVDAAMWSTPPREPDPRRIVMVSVGRLAARKRPLPLLRMLRAVRSQVPRHIELEAKLIGDGPSRAALQRYVARHGMSGWVHLPGALGPADIRRHLARADIYVAPATLESFGIAPLEARCAGVPVVGQAGCGISEFIHHGHEGLLGNGDADMVRHLSYLATNPAALRRLREHNRATASRHTWQHVLARCESLYAQAYALQGVARGAAAVTA